MTVDNVRQHLEAAFPVAPVPDGAELLSSVGAGSRKDKAERTRFVSSFQGKAWTSLDAAFLEAHWAPLSAYASARAYCYYLPAFIRRCLEDLSTRNQLLHTTANSLLCPDWYDLYHHDKARFQYQTGLLDASQKDVVCSFLELCFDQNIYLQQVARTLRWGWNRRQR